MVQVKTYRKFALSCSLVLGLSGCVSTTGGYKPPVEDRSSGVVQKAEPVRGVIVAPQVRRETPAQISTQDSVPAPVTSPAPRSSNPAVIALLDNAVEQKSTGQMKAAQSSLSRAQRIAPRDPEVYFQLADLNRLEGKYPQAEQLALKGTNLAIGDAVMLRRLWLLIADIRSQAGDYSASRKARKQAMQY